MRRGRRDGGGGGGRAGIKRGGLCFPPPPTLLLFTPVNKASDGLSIELNSSPESILPEFCFTF